MSDSEDGDKRRITRDALSDLEPASARYSDRKSHKNSSTHQGSKSHRGRQDDSDDNYRHRRPGRESRGERENDSFRKEQNYRDRSRSRQRSYRQQRSRSPPIKRRRRSVSNSRSPPIASKSRAPLPSQNESFRGERGGADPDKPPVEKEKPNYKPTGLLAKEANTVAGTSTVLKYHEPSEARKPPPKEQWRMYVFKKKDLLDTIYLYQRSVWLMGRDQTVTDLYLEHPSVSKQHAVIQFRYLTSTNEFGDKTGRVKPYLIDINSANGTKLNGKKIEGSRYVELVDGDVVAFGDSEREYVLMLPPTDK